MNYIQILANLDSKLTSYDKRLETMKNNHKSGKKTYSQKDWDITIYKIDRMELLYSKVGRKALQQFNQEDNIKVVNLSEFEPSNDIGGWEIPK